MGGVALAARDATACRRADVSWGLGWPAGICGGVAADVAPVGRRNMASMVGRREAPKGVERKSAGRSSSRGYFKYGYWGDQGRERGTFDPGGNRLTS